ncbi:ciliogenesis-associated TTC17-interacting protein-like isoform X3 [Phyllopteryx taeniolatus]|nr:ciliogenesis-associated TTC17-interacting protein-like isoform X3 [Phyllopteryx taeniolatus]
MCARPTAKNAEELSGFKENERRLAHDAVFKQPRDTADQSEKYLRPEQQEPQCPHIKEEEEEHPFIKEEPVSPHNKREEEPTHIKKEEETENSHIKVVEEEDDKLPLTFVTLKNEEDEDKGKCEENSGVEPPSRSSSQHMKTAGDGDHSGGSQARGLLAPLSDSDDITSHSPDTDDDDHDDEHAKG